MTDTTQDLPQVAMAFLGKFKNQAPDEVADRVAQLSGEIVDLLYLVASAHATNQIINYSNRIAFQVGQSYAANTFVDLQRSLIETEILRLVRLWDNPDSEKISIPTAYWMTRIPGVRDILDKRNTDVPEAWPGHLAEQLDRQQQLWRRLDRITPPITESSLLLGLRNFRDKRIAHWLLKSKADQKTVIKPASYGHERQLLNRTSAVANVLGLAVRATHFDFKGLREIAQKNAEAFWHGCTVKPLE